MKIGFIGLGMMGSGMAANLQKAGHELVVHDLRRAAAEPYLAAGAVWGETPRAVAEASEIVFTSLPGPPEVEAVALGDKARYVGPIGAGSVAKLVHNGAGYCIQTALAEMFTVGVEAGVEPLALWEAVREGASGRRRTFDGLIDQFLPGKYEPAAFALRLAHKDMSLATQLGRDFNVPMRVANLALAELSEALNRGWGHRDSRSPMLLQEERAGVEIRVDEKRLKEALDRDPPSR